MRLSGWPLAELLERDRELASIDRRVDEVITCAGRFAVIEGSPGIGKTALLAAVADRAAGKGLSVLSARGSMSERDLAFGIVRQLFESVFVRAAEEEQAELLTGPARLAAPALLLEGATGDDPSAALHGLYWLCANLADRRPLALLVDDAHWGDADSLRWLDYLVRRIDSLPLLLVLAVRGDTSYRELLSAVFAASPVELHTLRPLSEAATTQVVRRLLGADADTTFCAACHQATGGNPFYLSELLLAMRADGTPATSDGAASVARLAPATVTRSILLRLGRLGGEAVNLARAIAVLGPDASLARAAPLADLDGDSAQLAFDQLRGAELLASSEQLAFKHPIVAASVDGEIEPGARSIAHKRAAHLLEAENASPDRIAVHLVATAPMGDPWVVEQLSAAADWSLERAAPDAAATFLGRALAEPPDARSRPRLLLALGLAEVRAAEPVAVKHLVEAHTLAVDPRTRADAAVAAAGQLFLSGRLEHAVSILSEAVDQLGGDDPRRALELRAHLLAFAMYGPSALRPYASAQALDESIPADSGGARMMLSHLAYQRMWRSQDGSRAAELADRAWADGFLLAERGSEAPELSAVVLTLMRAERIEATARLVEAALADARERGSLLGFAHASFLRAELFLQQGALADAEADARAALEIAASAGIHVATAAATGSLISILVERGSLDDAGDALSAIDVRFDELPPSPQYNLLLGARGRLRVALGDLPRGLADLHECGARNAQLEIRHPLFVPWRVDAALAHRASGDIDGAQALSEEMISAASDWGTSGAIGVATRIAALLTTGDEAIRLLQEAATMLGRSPLRLEHAHALVDLGAALRRSGERARGRERLREGLDIAHRCGAGPLAKSARDELLIAGARPRRDALHGRDALTASELRIASMAASGLTNREIAQALFVTSKTVETHLRHTFEKLDITTRTDLAAALGADR